MNWQTAQGSFFLTITALAVAAGAQQAAPPVNFAADLTINRVEPNPGLAARWSGANVDKLVFDLRVTPHWYTTSDKFWYSFKTSSGTAYYVVDPLKGAKAALFDHAALAEQLTRLTGLPYDGEHLPIQNIKLINHDATLRFSLSVPRTAVIPGLAAETSDEAAAEESAAGQQGGRGGRGGAAGPT
ncbi:MAG: hypothetical protein ACRD1E_11965, partial [Terriglobales bacterium]